MTSSAPRERTNSTLATDAVAMTYAPFQWPSWTAIVPTPPAPPSPALHEHALTRFEMSGVEECNPRRLAADVQRCCLVEAHAVRDSRDRAGGCDSELGIGAAPATEDAVADREVADAL